MQALRSSITRTARLCSFPKSTQNAGPDPTEQRIRGSLELPEDNSALRPKGSQAADLTCRAPQAHVNQLLPSSVPASAAGALPDGTSSPAAPSAAGSAASDRTVPPSSSQPAASWRPANGSSAQPTTGCYHQHPAGVHSAPRDDAAASVLDCSAPANAVRAPAATPQPAAGCGAASGSSAQATTDCCHQQPASSGGSDDLPSFEEALASGAIGRDRQDGQRSDAAKKRRRKQYKANKKLKLSKLAQEPAASTSTAEAAPADRAPCEAAMREAALRAALRNKTELLKLERKRTRRDAATLTQRVRQEEAARQKARARKKHEHKARRASFAASRDDARRRKGKPLPDAPLHSGARKAQRLIASNSRPSGMNLSRP